MEKNNLIAHQKRQEKLNRERLDILSNKDLSDNEIIDKLEIIDNQIKENKNKWKEKRLMPLSIPGNTSKEGGNNFFTFSPDGSVCYAKFVRTISGTRQGKTITEEAEFSLNLDSMSNKRRKIFQELIKLGNLKQTPIMVRLNNDTIDITYDPIVLTPCIEQKRKSKRVKVKKDDSLEVKKLLTKKSIINKI